MKKTILTLCVVICSFVAPAQHSLDLQVAITDPADNSTFEYEEIFPYSITITNADTSDMPSGDTLALYLLMDGDTVTFYPDTVNHTDYANLQLQSQESYTITRYMTFMGGTGETATELCAYIRSRNSADPVTDPDLQNNESCITIHVVVNDLALSEKGWSDIGLFPNPAQTHFSLTGIGDEATIEVVDVNGSKIRSGRNADGSIDCSFWKDGVYFVRISDGENTCVKQLVIIH